MSEIRVALTCQIHQINQRDFISALYNSSQIELYVVTDSIQYESHSALPQNRIYHCRPSWPSFIALNYIHPVNRIRFQEALSRIDPDIVLSTGVSNLRFFSLITDFSPSVLLPMGGETERAMNQWRDGVKGQLYWRMYRWQFKKLLQHVDEVWSPEPNFGQFHALGLAEDQFRPFDWGVVDTNEYRRVDDPIKFVDNPEKTVIGSFRRIRGERLIPSYKTFLDAIDLLRQNRSDFHVVLGGFYESDDKGAEVERVVNQKVESLGLSDCITKLDMIPKGEMPRYYSGLDVYMNFNHKGHPLTGLGTASKEGMACECAYITFDDPPKSHIITNGDDGYIVSHSNPEALSQVLNSFCNDREKVRRFGRKARKTVVENFSYENVTKQMIKYINKIV